MPSYTLYVVELKKTVFTKSWKFRRANPQFNGTLECLYVGCTSKTPEVRLSQHKMQAKSNKGNKLSSKIVYEYGLYLRPSLTEHLSPFNRRKEAEKQEEALALSLRRQGYGVWFG